MTKYPLPMKYDLLTREQKREVREQYIREQSNLCWFCKQPLDLDPPADVLSKPLNMSLFPSNFLVYPVHLQHSHVTGLTEGAVHAYCNGVLWQYHGS